MKKLTAVLLIAAVFLSVLSGCGGGAAVPESAAPSAAAESPAAPEAEPAFAAWLDGYRKASEGFAVCEPVATVGRFVENNVVRLHDERTRCGSDLPLA